MIARYNFGCPTVGNRAFTQRLKRLVPKVFRVVVDGDVITAGGGLFFEHAGVEVLVEMTVWSITISPLHH